MKQPPKKGSGRFEYLPDLEAEVEKRQERRKRGQRERRESVWFGLGMFGVVGWSVMTPTLAGLFLGVWLDRHTSLRYSFTLMGMFAGLVTGCLLAWQWVERQTRDE